jgi:hypothetical protein
MSDKRPIELNMELELNYLEDDKHNELLKLTKTVEANFVPQHGMVVMFDEIPFRVKTVALANLSGLRHVAYPMTTKGVKFISRNVSQKGKEWFASRSEHFKKLGWRTA